MGTAATICHDLTAAVGPSWLASVWSSGFRARVNFLCAAHLQAAVRIRAAAGVAMVPRSGGASCTEGYLYAPGGHALFDLAGCSLVIAMDCGIKAHGTIAGAAAHGIDFIVCDHHLPEGALPPAYANLDPKRADCPYPYKELSGCGIAFKLAQAFAVVAGSFLAACADHAAKRPPPSSPSAPFSAMPMRIQLS